ncbi:olfactory marker protein a [Amia ocellicauda]|uniref:olfactory marker protein a n=1 Tax=Amia ocellicauda TaxID=2972642 RepID=UPI00346409B0|nr:OMP protein [Amia calva]MBN3309553.1 OMP protein [Amia calva]
MQSNQYSPKHSRETGLCADQDRAASKGARETDNTQTTAAAAATMASVLELPFQEDTQLTEVMRLRVQSLQQRNHRPQDGERLLRPQEVVYRLDFSQQNLRFQRWSIQLSVPGKITITGISQLWTPDLTNLMTRQLLEPAGIFWKKSGEEQVQCYEADTQEFGERIAELAKIRKVMYFLLSFEDGTEPANINCSIAFKASP